MLTRWETLYEEMAERVLPAPPSLCVRRAVELFSQYCKRRVLDLACGAGRETVYLAAHGLLTIGVDAAQSGLALAMRRTTDERRSLYSCADARRLPFPDSSFDGVYCFGLFHEFVNETRQADTQSIISEIKRVLAPSGLLVLAVLSGDHEKGLPHVYMYSEEEFDELGRGFRVVEKREYVDAGCTGATNYKVRYGAFVLE